MTIEVTPQLLSDLLKYEPETGRLYWRKRKPQLFSEGCHGAEHHCRCWNTRYAGKEAFRNNHKQGYRQGFVLGKCLKGHRVIWAIMTGSWPNEVDHINGDPGDNRWCNLREVTRLENNKNAAIGANNTSGHKGVSLCRRSGLWRARINHKGRRVHLGRFPTFEQAVAARTEAERHFGFHPNHGRTPAVGA